MKPDDILIRAVTRDDVPAVIAHVTEVLAEYGLTFGEGSATDADLQRLPEAYAEPGGAFWVATTPDGALVATCGIAPLPACDPKDAGLMELRKMYLSSRLRGLGIGRRLLDQAVGFARRAGARAIVLDTIDGMEQAISFYERAGFTRDDSQIRGSRCERGYRLDLTPSPD